MGRDLADAWSYYLISMQLKRPPVLFGWKGQFPGCEPVGSAAFLESLPEPGGVGIKGAKFAR